MTQSPTRFDLLVNLLVTDYRTANPSSRIVHPIKLVRNGSSVKQYGCALCGEKGPTFCSRYPETKRSIEWYRAHTAQHVAKADAKHKRALRSQPEAVAL